MPSKHATNTTEQSSALFSQQSNVVHTQILEFIFPNFFVVLDPTCASCRQERRLPHLHVDFFCTLGYANKIRVHNLKK